MLDNGIVVIIGGLCTGMLRVQRQLKDFSLRTLNPLWDKVSAMELAERVEQGVGRTMMMMMMITGVWSDLTGRTGGFY